MITNSEISRYMVLTKKSKTQRLTASEKNEALMLKEKYVSSLKLNKKTSVSEADINRINELSKKNKAGVLSKEEDEEYVTLRLAFVLATKKNVAAQVNNIDVVEKDGSIENLGEKYGKQ